MNRETYSFVQVSDVIGRDNDKENIIIHLLKDTDHADQNVSVISITGLGGLGKTTLAKLVYNDSTVVRNFDLRMWVCVSYDFDNKSLVRKIIGSATNQKCEEDSFENLAIKLQNELKDTKFLLVLDDVWDKEPMGISITKWIELKALLNIGARGSKIIVTTRNMSVVSLLGSVDYQHPLEGLSHEDCMSLFVERAFRKEEEKNFPHLMEVANNIVKKCGGVPLAVTTLGGMLYLKRELRDWLHVRDNDIWKLEQREDGILPALKLSYDALPLYLKPCFAFCSLFPKDYEFDSVEIVTMWMAQGFLHSSTRNEQDFEEIGLDYIRQLCSRSFFHIEEDDFFCMRFKMHDLIHDLAILVAQVEYSSVNFHQSGPFDRVRHLSIYTKDLSDNEEVPNFMI
ncbi:disease resistance protein RGA2-like [Rosa rugosa]|uniref:disease resistance protein RGA2-like n=1 Tax=Rosa rugosa TaxID=74645 RepID=UPI002B41764F|nr:disease resistance protein RGA2-like [Rosa rugosa]XP_062013101.1 disease resistance protein RGA2-like [Rosa rugosa]XP_062013102.1 disease resistance protein RGA2-like [Rosa rugosa]XP_062013103.1 disease resistance protein RGA2-like [Rosa rugosa]